MLPAEIDYFHLIASASLIVQFVLLVLLLFSVASWAIIFIKFRYLRKAFMESADFTEFFWKSRDLSGAFARAKQFDISPVARVFRIGYLELKRISRASGAETEEKSDDDTAGNRISGSDNFQRALRRAGLPAMREKPDNDAIGNRISGSDNVQRALRRAITSEITRMTQLVPFLATTGNTSPFIGLFGTVWGIMNSFHGIGVRGSANLAVVAPGIAEALIATAAGLAVAIPSVIFFNYFTQKIRTIESELHSFSADFINIIERDIFQNKRSGR
ncbi:MAG: MotA/TolQ/ExbB proton channel family protein [Desulfobacterales bacterium]|jgi:biopolymer transport protein TolQ|nr:MotA/TolQ/ExbB proton channel family protein [Desulfobacterales bacterium]